MSALRPGVLVYRAKDHSGVVAVGPGFLQVAAPTQAGGADTARDRVLVLVDQAMPAGDIDRAEAERDLVAADKELAAWKGELDGAFKALDLRRQWAQARVDACGRGPGAAH
jgi:F0F1-type ATP synthase epsilon subunit